MHAGRVARYAACCLRNDRLREACFGGVGENREKAKRARCEMDKSHDEIFELYDDSEAPIVDLDVCEQR